MCNLGDTLSFHFGYFILSYLSLPGDLLESACNERDQVQSLGQEDPLEKGMATHSRILAWRMPRTEEPGGLQPTGPQRVRHKWVTSSFTLSNSTYFSSMFWIYCTSWTSPHTRRLSLGSQTHSFFPVPEYTSHSFNMHLPCWEIHTVDNQLNFSYHSEALVSFSSLKHYT